MTKYCTNTSSFNEVDFSEDVIIAAQKHDSILLGKIVSFAAVSTSIANMRHVYNAELVLASSSSDT